MDLHVNMLMAHVLPLNVQYTHTTTIATLLIPTEEKDKKIKNEFHHLMSSNRHINPLLIMLSRIKEVSYRPALFSTLGNANYAERSSCIFHPPKYTLENMHAHPLQKRACGQEVWLLCV